MTARLQAFGLLVVSAVDCTQASCVAPARLPAVVRTLQLQEQCQAVYWRQLVLSASADVSALDHEHEHYTLRVT